MTRNRYQQALDVVVFEKTGLTVRGYLHTLLDTLWTEKEGFSGKRPLGDSGWEYDLYAPLIKAGFIGGKLDPEGYVELMDKWEADYFIKVLIIQAFYPGEA